MIQDLGFALRMLRKNVVFTAIVTLSIALGIGATTTVFCWIQHVLLRPFPGVLEQDRIVVLTTTLGSTMWDTTSLPDLKDVAGLDKVFAGVIGSQVTPACLTAEGQSTWLYGQVATSNFFAVLGVKPLLGRTFAIDDDTAENSQPVIVLSEMCWRRLFAADPGLIGRSVELNRRSFTVIGIVPAEFRGTMGGLQCDFWAPVDMHRVVANFGSLSERSDHWLHTQARLQPGVSRTQAQAAVDTLMAQLEQAYPNSNRDIRLRVLPLWKSPYGAQERLLPLLAILFAVSIGVLLIVIANTTNLQLARAITRRKEIAIRFAAGAGRLRIVRQLLVESVVLAGLGGVLGILFASWGTWLLAAFIPETHLPVALGTGLDGRTLAFSAGTTLAAGILFGLAPALQLTRENTSEVLKESGRGTTGVVQHRLRNAFVVVQVALALQLLVGAGLCIKGASRARQIHLGFEPRHVLVAGLRIGMHGYTEETGTAFYRDLHQRLIDRPDVESAALASWFPLGFEGGPSVGIGVPGYDRKSGEDLSIPFSIISPRYFETLQIGLVDGRDFNANDTRDSAPVVIINEVMAQRFWPGQNPIGRTINALGRNATVVGVVQAGRYRYLGERATSFVYFPYAQCWWNLSLGTAVRTVGDPAAFIQPLQEEVRAIDPAVTVWTAMPMTTFIGAAFFAQDTAARLNIALGGVALVLAALGIYGVVAYLVSMRVKEIGVRMALGAVRRDILALVVGGGLRLVLMGMAVGLAAALATARLLTGFLPGLNPFDPIPYTGALVVVGAAALLACWGPAHRATRIEPLGALRTE